MTDPTRGAWQRWRRFLMRAVAATALLLLLLMVWGVAIEPRVILDEQHFDVPLPGLSRDLDGMRVAVIADVQIGMWLANRAMVRRIVARIIALRPDVVLIAGDFIYDWSDGDAVEIDDDDDRAEDTREMAADIREVAGMVAPLATAGLEVFAVLGNHDYGMMWPTSRPRPQVADAVTEGLRRVGITVLRNKAQTVALRGTNRPSPLFVVGIDAHAARRDDVVAALAAVPAGAPRIAVMHNPDSFAAFPAGAAPLAVAGHTHGGQVRLPLLPRWSWMMLAKEEPVHADGWIGSYGALGNRLYVNRGIGFSTLPVRINCPPELTIITLRAE